MNFIYIGQGEYHKSSDLCSGANTDQLSYFSSISYDNHLVGKGRFSEIVRRKNFLDFILLPSFI